MRKQRAAHVHGCLLFEWRQVIAGRRSGRARGRAILARCVGPVLTFRTFRLDDTRQPARAHVRRAQSEVPRAAGHPFIATPNLDALAARGTRFTSAYTTCPICVPARAAFAVGRYVHEIGYWDNADAYEGAIPSWHHALRDAGHRVVSIGKLHFRGRPGDDHGFSEEIVPMHIIDGIGDVKGLVREDIPKRKGGDKMAKRAGPGESPYTVYDRDIAARAQIWLHEEAPKWRDRPWVLFVSFVLPHFPLTAPPHWFYRYWQQDLPMPKLYAKRSPSASSVSRHVRAHGRLRCAFRVARPTSSARSPGYAASCRRWTRTSATSARAARRGA